MGTKLRTANLSRRLFLPVLVAKYMANHSSLQKDTEPHILLSICPLASSSTTQCPLLPVNRKPCYLSPSAHLPPHMQKQSNPSIANYALHRTHLQVRGPVTSLFPRSPISREPNGNKTSLATSLSKKEYPGNPWPGKNNHFLFVSVCDSLTFMIWTYRMVSRC